jgi:hypothetical protein
MVRSEVVVLFYLYSHTNGMISPAALRAELARRERERRERR